jgi:lipopolysaccharide transport system ATP-binding protein
MSSNQPAIAVRDLSKSYTIRRNAAKHTTLADAVVDRIKHPFRRSKKEVFWALRDLNFEVAPGEIVGIIGRNGAGKSTLLKILSRITRPTSGEVELHGRVGSLLEVGTGFHQELTGRENIYLSGTILGMKRRVIKAQFDAIVDFASVEQFLDTPVKRYSSGMYVRLAFAVAAHLNPEILLVDEVLSVGDAEFQEKCLGKMKDISHAGRTILFVSHHMHSISVLCQRAVVLDHGSVIFSGDITTGVSAYVKSIKVASQNKDIQSETNRLGSGEYRYEFVQIEGTLNSGEALCFRYRIRKRRGNAGRMYLSAQLYNERGSELLRLDSRLVGTWIEDAPVIEGKIKLTSPWLKPGTYWLSTFICTASGVIDGCEGICHFEINSVLPYAYTTSAESVLAGLVFGDYQWSTQSPPSETTALNSA